MTITLHWEQIGCVTWLQMLISLTKPKALNSSKSLGAEGEEGGDGGGGTS